MGDQESRCILTPPVPYEGLSNNSDGQQNRLIDRLMGIHNVSRSLMMPGGRDSNLFLRLRLANESLSCREWDLSRILTETLENWKRPAKMSGQRGKTYPKAKPHEDGPLETILESLRKWCLRRSPEGNAGMSNELNKRDGKGGGSIPR